MEDCNLLIGSVWQLLPPKPIVFNIVDGLKVENGPECRYQEEHAHLGPAEVCDKCCEQYGSGNTKYCIVGNERFPLELLHHIDTLVRS